MLDTEDITKIAGAYHAWRSREPETPYEDVPGFCKAAAVDEVVQHDFVLTPGRYVGAAEAESDGEAIEDKLARLRKRLVEEFEEADRLEAIIRERLKDLVP